MINLFKKYIFNKNFILWFLIFLILLIVIFYPMLNFKVEYMADANITDYIYVFYTYMLPMTFFDNGIVTSLMLDGCFLAIVCYISICYINLFFEDYSSITLTRINRSDWLNNIYKINLIFSLVVAIVYVCLFLIMCLINDLGITFSSNIFIPILYKIMLAILIPNLYLLFYIATKNYAISLGFSFSFYIIFEILIKGTFNENLLTFNYWYLIFLYFIIIYFILYLFSKKLFLRRDI